MSVFAEKANSDFFAKRHFGYPGVWTPGTLSDALCNCHSMYSLVHLNVKKPTEAGSIILVRKRPFLLARIIRATPQYIEKNIGVGPTYCSDIQVIYQISLKPKKEYSKLRVTRSRITRIITELE